MNSLRFDGRFERACVKGEHDAIVRTIVHAVPFSARNEQGTVRRARAGVIIAHGRATWPLSRIGRSFQCPGASAWLDGPAKNVCCAGDPQSLLNTVSRSRWARHLDEAYRCSRSRSRRFVQGELHSVFRWQLSGKFRALIAPSGLPRLRKGKLRGRMNNAGSAVIAQNGA